MVDLHSILATHHSKTKPKKSDNVEAEIDRKSEKLATLAEIPDLLFDDILVKFKLNRVEVLVLLYLYRQVYCRPNLYKVYGFTQLLSHTEISRILNVSLDDVYHALRKLDDIGFIGTIRSGQYFVRKYFTEENDHLYGQIYDDF